MGGAAGAISSVVRRDLTGQKVTIHGKTYQLEKKLGSGGFGSVYSARTSMGTIVAVKIMDISSMPENGPILVDSYLNEIKHLQRLRRATPFIIQIYDFGFDSKTGRAYIVMELADQSLDKLIESVHEMHSERTSPGNYIPAKNRKIIWRQMLPVIQALHANNTVHMDLKPANLLMVKNVIKIADLGISKKGHLPILGGMGTMGYSAPEVMRDMSGRPKVFGPKADIWSLGVILYYMTYGAIPSYHPGAANPPKGQPPTRDPLLRDILMRTLVLDPNRRITMQGLMMHPYTNS